MSMSNVNEAPKIIKLMIYMIKLHIQLANNQEKPQGREEDGGALYYNFGNKHCGVRYLSFKTS